MAHNTPTVRPPRSSLRYSPYYRFPAASATSALPPPIPFDQLHFSSFGPSRSSRPSKNAPSHASVNQTYSATLGNPPVHPFLRSHPFYTTPSSPSTRQLEHVASSFAPPPAPLSLLPLHQNSSRLPHPAMKTPYPDPGAFQAHSLQNSEPSNVAQPSLNIHQPDNPTYQDIIHQQPLQIPQGQPATLQRPGHSPYARYQTRGMFSGSHHLSFSDNTFIDNSTTSENFMEKLLEHTIIGAEFDSSERYPPPRCHPGTRLAIVERCKDFIVKSHGNEKTRWIVGPAGVGKSAIMQIVAEETLDNVILGASVFLSVNGRQDGTKIVTTIAYQLAAKCEPYRQFIQSKISRDPSLLRKSLPVQFQTFIVDPFIHQRLFDHAHRYVIIIDGLDECDSRPVQCNLLGLILHFCSVCPTSHVVWLVASRPEAHIISIFENPRFASGYTKEEIVIDSDEACADVQWYLREELNRIKNAYFTLRRKREWPSEFEFTKIAAAAGGLFAYASTVVRYIDGHDDPAAQLCHVLAVIDATPRDNVSIRGHPMAQLDALYKRILSNIPTDAMMNTRKLLLTISRVGSNFRPLCNLLGLTEGAAYGAARHLYAVAKVPTPDDADVGRLEYFHKSFGDFLLDFERSGFFHNPDEELEQLLAESSLRIILEVPDNLNDMASEECIGIDASGDLKTGQSFLDHISLSWPADEYSFLSDDELRFRLHCNAISNIRDLFKPRTRFYRGMSWFHFLTTRFPVHVLDFPIYQLRDYAFDVFRAELRQLGKLVQVPLGSFDYAAICGRIDCLFMSPGRSDVRQSDPWNPSCQHGKDDMDGPQASRGWSTSFKRCLDYPRDDVGNIDTDIPRFNIQAGQDSHLKSTGSGLYSECLYCSQRFARCFIDNPDRLVTVFVDSTDMSYVEWWFVDPDDGMSEWRYRFCHSGSPSCLN